jgi:hypothetical protein
VEIAYVRGLFGDSRLADIGTAFDNNAIAIMTRAV